MDFPKNEVQTLLAWMREQMYGDTVTEWTYGNESVWVAAQYTGIAIYPFS